MKHRHYLASVSGVFAVVLAIAGLFQAVPHVALAEGDVTPPETTISGAPANPSYGGVAFSFSSDEPGSTFECQLDEGGWVACTSPRVHLVLAVGEHTFQVRATDEAGNVDASPASFAWRVGRVALVPAGILSSTSIYHNCALTPSGAADCWGGDYYGQAEDQPGPYTRVAVGGWHTCALTPSGAAECWGYNGYGEADDQPGPYTELSAGVYHTCGLTPAGDVECWGSNDYGESAHQLGPYTLLGVGGRHSCALTPSGAVDCWGSNDYGESAHQLGPYTQIGSGAWHTCALTPSGAVDCWGWNDYGQAEDRPGPYTHLGVGGWHTCALTPSGAVDCWGFDADTVVVSRPGPYIQVSAGRYHVCALTPAGAADCWGENTEGRAEDQPGPYGPANTAPVADPGEPYLVQMNIALAFDGTGSSDAEGDPLTYAWAFGDGSTRVGATPSHSYVATGVYDVCLVVHDGRVDSEPACTLAVVYDPDGGFVTGGGWFNSPAGAYLADPNLTGKATFGFVTKYLKGAQVPSGTTEFQFKAGSLNFHSETYEWLVVNQGGSNAQFKGSGTVNGAPDPNGNEYKFMIWATDGSPDTLRIRIWWEVDGVENDVYDNGAVQAIDGGSIVVHKSN